MRKKEKQSKKEKTTVIDHVFPYVNYALFYRISEIIKKKYRIYHENMCKKQETQDKRKLCAIFLPVEKYLKL